MDRLAEWGIVNIHNPSIEVHRVDRSLNTGAAVILVAGGGHRTLNVGSESADFVPFFYNYGVNTIILRNRLRRDGYNRFGLAAELAEKNAAAGKKRCAEYRSAVLQGLAALQPQFNGDPERALVTTLNLSIPGLDSEAFMLATKGLIAVSNGPAE